MCPPDERLQSGPSTTNPQCKVCTSDDRFEIEVALAEGQSQELIARRFSRDGQAFSRQNIHSHYHKHMQVIEQAVLEVALERRRDRKLDLKTATEIERQNEANRARLRAHAAAAIDDLRWRPRDVIAFMKFDAMLVEQQAAAGTEFIMQRARLFSQAVREVVTDDQGQQILEAYDRAAARADLEDPDCIFDPDNDA
jgi:hypothetical protein